MNAPRNHLKELREAAGHSQLSLAMAAGVSQPTIANIERRHRPGGLRIRLALARALGADVAQVFPDEVPLAAWAPCHVSPEPVAAAA